MASNSTTGIRPRKRRNRDLPPKPQKDFPMTPRISGYQCRKIYGQMRYFGLLRFRINGKVVRLAGDEWDAGWQYAKRLHDAQIDDSRWPSTQGCEPGAVR